MLALPTRPNWLCPVRLFYRIAGGVYGCTSEYNSPIYQDTFTRVIFMFIKIRDDGGFWKPSGNSMQAVDGWK